MGYLNHTAAASADVYLLEDDPLLGDLLERSLVRQGQRVRRFAYAEDVEAALHECPSAVLVSDVRLSGPMSGLELVERMRARGDERPALIMSGSHDSASKLAAHAAGAGEFLLKPFSLANFARAVARMVASRAVQTQPAPATL